MTGPQDKYPKPEINRGDTKCHLNDRKNACVYFEKRNWHVWKLPYRITKNLAVFFSIEKTGKLKSVFY